MCYVLQVCLSSECGVMNWDIVFCDLPKVGRFKSCYAWGGGGGHQRQLLQNQVALSQMLKMSSTLPAATSAHKYSSMFSHRVLMVRLDFESFSGGLILNGCAVCCPL